MNSASPPSLTFQLRPDAPTFVPPPTNITTHNEHCRPENHHHAIARHVNHHPNNNDHYKDHRVPSQSRRHRPRRPSVPHNNHNHHHHNTTTTSSSSSLSFISHSPPPRKPKSNTTKTTHCRSRRRPPPHHHHPPPKTRSSFTPPPSHPVVNETVLLEPEKMEMDASGIPNFPTLPSSVVVSAQESQREVWSHFRPPGDNDHHDDSTTHRHDPTNKEEDHRFHLVTLSRHRHPHPHSSNHTQRKSTDTCVHDTTTTTTVVTESNDHHDTPRQVPQRPPALRMNQLRDRWWKLVRDYHRHDPDPDLAHNNDDDTTNAAPPTTAHHHPRSNHHNHVQHAIVVTPPEEIPVSGSSSTDDEDDGHHESVPPTRDTPTDHHETLSVAVRFNQASKLRTWCRRQMMQEEGRTGSRSSSGRSSSSAFESSTTTSVEAIPLLLAVERGHDECVLILLSYFGISSLLTCRDAQGNTALHTSCGSTAHRTTFSILLDSIITSTGYTKSLLFKSMSSRNHQQQTPLHVAAQCQRSDVIDLILSHRGTSNLSMLTKLLSITDLKGQTPFLAAVAANAMDVVMSLQMWRGHHHPPPPPLSLLKPAPLANNPSALPHSKHHHVKHTNHGGPRCPLAWAVQYQHIDMTALLLEFNNPSSESGYRLNHALRVAVIQKAHGAVTENDDDDDDDDSIILDMIRILLAAGANPCAIDADDDASTALSLASLHGKPERLARLWHSHDEYLCRIRRQRRQDPKLQRQPESFFIGMESTEQTERQNAGKEALLISLSLIRSGSHTTRMNRHGKCCLVLYEQGIQLGPSDLVQLKHSMNLDVVTKPQYQASYERIRSPCGSSASHDTHQVEHDDYWSRVMSTLPWFEPSHTSKCAGFTSTPRRTDLRPAPPPPDVTLICHDGALLLAHRVVLRQRSQKLAAALRFAAMADQGHFSGECTILTTETDTTNTLEIDLPYDICRQLLIHMYHGSLLFFLEDWPNRYECGEQLLALLLVGDEYICPTLTCECVGRLLASVDTYDRCVCSTCCHNFVLETKEEKYVTFHVSGPSHLITAALALDILAVVQQIHWSLDGYNDTDNDNSNTMKQSIHRKRTLMDDLREVTLLVAIGDFETVRLHLVRKDETVGPANHTCADMGERLLTSLVNDLRDMGRLV